ncbi:MAG: hypothetical protein QY326_04230 [Bdellovibrionota bacterium]|nr:MAG: hypothetical protein QY326_04230 [Bdellovibrionota bacterium]
MQLLPPVESRSLRSTIFLLALTLSSVANAQSIPDSLKEWLPWVAQRFPERNCALVHKERVCVWPKSLRLEVSNKGATFEYIVSLDREGSAPLPGGGDAYPSDITVRSDTTSVETRLISKDGRLEVALPAGTFRVNGTFQWDAAPRAIRLPDGLSQLELIRNGKAIATPRISDGAVWLAQEDTVANVENDSLTIEVSRLIADGVPMLVTTAIDLRVSGKPRELTLGTVVPDGFFPVRVTSPLPYHLTGQQAFVLQARPGKYHIRIDSVTGTPPQELKTPDRSKVISDWPTEEVWTFQPQEDLRNVVLSGGLAIDPERTSLPSEWRHLRAFLFNAGEALHLQEVRRGEETSPRNSLSVDKTLWLDLDGSGFTVRDTIRGQMFQQWRLNAHPSVRLGRASVNEQDQLITNDPLSNEAGVELREQSLSMVTHARIEDASIDLPASGWQHEVQSVRASLMVPPGWTLLSAPGTDHATGSWLASWSLLDVFLVLLVAVASFKLLGIAAGILVGAVLILSHGQPFSPLHLWFHLLASLALMRYLPEGSVRQLATWYYRLTLGLVGLVAIAFGAEQIRVGLFPQTSLSGGVYGFFLEGMLYLAESSVITWLACCLLIVLGGAVLVALAKGEIGKAFRMAFLVAGVFILTVMLNVFTAGIGMRESAYQTKYFNTEEALQDEAAVYERAAEGMVAPLTSRLESGSAAVMSAQNLMRKKSFQQDPKAVIQTGPGLPTWRWRQFNLSWQGPVSQSDTFSLMLIGPKANLFLSLLRVVLLLAFLWLLIKSTRRWITATALLIFLVIPARTIAQGYPSQELLRELSERLVEHDCPGDCAVIESMEIEAGESSIRMRARVSARGNSAVGLPGPLSQMTLRSLIIDGSPVSHIRSDSQGFIWARLSDGSHSVDASFDVRRLDMFALQFPLRPLFTRVRSEYWTAEGISATGLVTGSLQLLRKARSNTSSEEQQAAEVLLNPWYQVTRIISLDLPWTVSTTVTRLYVEDRPTIIRVPLLDGEQVNDDAVKVDGAQAIVPFSRGSSTVSWQSSIAEQEVLRIKAAQANSAMSETWVLYCSPIWRCNAKGINPTSSIQNGSAGFLWQPFPAESVEVQVSKPMAAEGESVTIESVEHTVSPGKKLMEGSISMSIRASQGGTQPITLPQDAKLSRLLVNGRDETSRVQGVSLSIPLEPGASTINISYILPRDLSIRTEAPAIQIKGTAYNVTTVMNVPASRWLLLTTGPVWGPVVLFWAKLIVVLIGAWILGKVPLSPIGTASWILLGLGLASLSIPSIVIPVSWLLLLELRRRKQPQDRKLYNASQIGLALLTLAALRVLYEAIRTGLILSPNMLVSGNGSSNSVLRWYVDQSEGALPAVSALWLPMWAWHTVMIVWSLWLVLALLRWLTRGFESLSVGGLWRKAEEKKAA